MTTTVPSSDAAQVDALRKSSATLLEGVRDFFETCTHVWASREDNEDFYEDVEAVVREFLAGFVLIAWKGHQAELVAQILPRLVQHTDEVWTKPRYGRAEALELMADAVALAAGLEDDHHRCRECGRPCDCVDCDDVVSWEHRVSDDENKCVGCRVCRERDA
jgi:hypothetical protein